MESTIRLFGLIVGIDSYKQGTIWNLESCVDDAKKVQRWLLKDLSVPKDHVCMLLDKEAIADNIERSFSSHLIQNTKIHRGDAIVVYFSCHGSTVRSPEGPGTEVLCTYDFGQGEVVGLSDRALQTMLLDLSKAKGDNITVILDSCFSPLQSPANIRDRRNTRWAPSDKIVARDASPDRPTPSGRDDSRDVGFHRALESYTFLAACGSGEKALEAKEGGRFTSAFLETVREMPLHNMSCAGILEHVRSKMGGGQRPFAAGLNVKRPLFDRVPFIPDARYFQVDFAADSKLLRIGLGTVHGVVEGTEFSVHAHNLCGLYNPAMGSALVTHVYPTWSFAQTKASVPPTCWVQVRRWNNRGLGGLSVGVKTKRSSSLLRRPSRVSLQTTARSLLSLPKA
ncbi:hypothetical protein B0H16DRAFT_1511267 [Mycena metata]|uniref:Peptidase C14 caspase domain-containing protein n=1 Tax=Mycena metata TaxID=1033252 RepID=A0AAD7JYN0_9AGAR|nr:hypothetical protein B0H16DRAFT_1511267 [Mycena metata]